MRNLCAESPSLNQCFILQVWEHQPMLGELSRWETFISGAGRESELLTGECGRLSGLLSFLWWELHWPGIRSLGRGGHPKLTYINGHFHHFTLCKHQVISLRLAHNANAMCYDCGFISQTMTWSMQLWHCVDFCPIPIDTTKPEFARIQCKWLQFKWTRNLVFKLFNYLYNFKLLAVMKLFQSLIAIIFFISNRSGEC